MKYLVVLIGMLTSLSLSAQDQEAMEKIQAARIALITQRLDLTPTQAEKFWPLYNEYRQRREDASRDFRNARKNHNPETASDEENRRLLDMGTRVKERQLELEKEYSGRMLQVISNRQMVNLRKAESDFRQMILDRLRQQQQRNQKLRQNNQQIQKRRNN